MRYVLRQAHSSATPATPPHHDQQSPHAFKSSPGQPHSFPQSPHLELFRHRHTAGAAIAATAAAVQQLQAAARAAAREGVGLGQARLPLLHGAQRGRAQVVDQELGALGPGGAKGR